MINKFIDNKLINCFHFGKKTKVIFLEKSCYSNKIKNENCSLNLKLSIFLNDGKNSLIFFSCCYWKKWLKIKHHQIWINKTIYIFEWNGSLFFIWINILVLKFVYRKSKNWIESNCGLDWCTHTRFDRKKILCCYLYMLCVFFLFRFPNICVMYMYGARFFFLWINGS